ncbi:MAG: hypothetical protein ACYCW6_15885, partial [Candidatus Xenobia bacterium]
AMKKSDSKKSSKKCPGCPACASGVAPISFASDEEMEAFWQRHTLDQFPAQVQPAKVVGGPGRRVGET